jgi:hypothetical protein
MTLRKQKAHRFVPDGLSDTVDGSSAPAGSMSSLQNMIKGVNTKGVMVPRPAMTQLIAWPDYGGGPCTALRTFGATSYGMYASLTFPGKDRPFSYNNIANSFNTISGLNASNLPNSQPTTGDWVPPTVAVVSGRVVFTHPGFTDGPNSPQAVLTFTGTTHSTTSLTAISPNFLNVPVPPQVGMRVFGPGIAGSTTIAAVDVAGGSVTLSVVPTSTTVGGQFTVVPNQANKFGWLDIGGFSVNITANTYSGLPSLLGNFNLSGIQPGMLVSGPGIVTGTTVQFLSSPSLDVSLGVTSGSSAISISLSQLQLIGAGMLLTASVFPPNTTISSVTYGGPLSSTTQEFFADASTTATGGPGPIAGTLDGSFITLSQSATASTDQEMIAIAGGTPAAPLWAAGDMNINPLASIPVFVAQFNNRAWFGVNTPTTAGVQASDAGIPTQQTTISQTLLFEDGVPVNAGTGLALYNQLGGIVQSLMVFQQDANIRQITGDFSLSNIAVNSLLNAVGTFSPNSIAPTPKGLLFIASDGMRLIDFNANVSDPIGLEGAGISVPFINVVFPSRTAAAYNEDVYRVTVIWQPPPVIAGIWGSAQRTDEFWFHLSKGKWSGPHTSTLDLGAPWPTASSFIAAPMVARGFFYRSDPQPLASSTYSEFGVPLPCVYQTSLMPDNPEGMANAVMESTIFTGLVSGSAELLVTAIDDMGQVLDMAYIWIGPFSTPAQRAILWHHPLVFRQMMLQISTTGSAQGFSFLLSDNGTFLLSDNGESLIVGMATAPAALAPNLQLGAIMIRHQQLGYQIPYPIGPELVLGTNILGGGPVLGP